MTSQAMILTKRLGILATDRQQTMADGKTYGGMEKIFELSELHSSAMMINGNADFGDVPIETLIREFKFETNFDNIETIEEIKNKFIIHLSKNTSSSTTNEFLKTSLNSFKRDLALDIEEYGFEEVLNERPRKRIFPFIEKYSNFSDEFNDIIPNMEKNKYNVILWEMFSFELQYEATGVIIAGYDLQSHYPTFFEIELYYNDDGEIIYEIVDYVIDSKEPIVKVFAINEEAYTFITGVNGEFIDFILRYISDANNSIIKNITWDLEQENVNDIELIIEFLKQEQEKEYSKLQKHIDDFRLNTLEDTTYSIENLPDGYFVYLQIC